jgi:hypothetical protein
MVFRKNPDSELSETIMRKSMNKIMLNKRPAAIRPLGRARCPDYREDGRHPKYKDHGRIAGC